MYVVHKNILINYYYIITGTGNGIAVGCYGCPDAQTATLAIIAGGCPFTFCMFGNFS